MDASRQSLLIGDPLQETSQRDLLVFRQRGQQGLLVFTRDLADGLQSRFPFLSQVQRVAAPVAFVRPSLQETLGFQFVNNRYETTRQRAERRRQRLLSNGGCRRENPENAGMGRDEFQLSQTRRKLRCGMRAELGQQKGRAAGTSSRRFHTWSQTS